MDKYIIAYTILLIISTAIIVIRINKIEETLNLNKMYEKNYILDCIKQLQLT